MHIGRIRLGKWTCVGLGLDVLDWMIVGAIPVAGDVLDVVATLIWWRVAGTIGLVDLVELVPGADMLPTNLALGLYADNKARQKPSQAPR